MRILGNSKGAAAIECALILCLIAIVAIACMKSVGNSMNTKLVEVSSALGSGSSGSGEDDNAGSSGENEGAQNGCLCPPDCDGNCGGAMCPCNYGGVARCECSKCRRRVEMMM